MLLKPSHLLRLLAAAPVVAVFAGVAPLAGCSSSPAAGEDTSTTFIAFETDFKNFRQWQSFHFTNPSDIGGGVHTAGPRTEYINAMPAPGLTAFPVRTIIVKVIETDPPQIFAMVKRGGNYDPAGAVNWEWFELKELESTVAIGWRGFGPPAGEKYGGDPSAGCSSCHTAAVANDYVQSPVIRLQP